MKLENLSFLGGKIGREIDFSFYDTLNKRNVTLTDDVTPNPDLRKAFEKLKPYIDKAFDEDSGMSENFVPVKVKMSESGAEFFVTIYGKFKTSYDDTITINTGKIPTEEHEDLQLLLQDIKFELYSYFYKGKNGEPELPFPEGDSPEEKE